MAAVLSITFVLLVQPCAFCVLLDPLPKIERERVHVQNNTVAVLAVVQNVVAVL